MTFPSSPFPHVHVIATCTACSADYCFTCRYTTVDGERWEDCTASVAKCGTCDPERLIPGRVAVRTGLDFPILRSSPLWAQTWVPHLWHRRFHGDSVDVGSGNWFPPLQCGPNGFGDRKKFVDSRGRDWLLYSTDNCPDCTAALQAVELMVYSVAWEFAQWPDEWEHRCWFAHRNGGCWCGQFSRVLSGEWKLWWPDGYGLRLQKPTTTASIIDLIRSTLIEPIVAEWSSYEP